MVRRGVLLVVVLLASGCLTGTEDGGDDPGVTSSSSSTSTTTSSSSTYTPPPPTVLDAWSPGNWMDGTCPQMQPIMAPYFFHDLAVRNGSRIVVLRSGADSGSRYVVHAQGAEGTHFVAGAPGAVFAAKGIDGPTGRIVKYDADLKELASVQVGEVGSLHRDGDTLYVGGLGRLTTLSLDLAVKDVLEFDDGGSFAKRIDYIATQNNLDVDVAYLVDDVVLPYRLYRVDITDPTDLRELGNHTVHSSSSPGPQWIDREARQWYVGTNFYGRGPDSVGYSETATAIGLDGAAAEEPVPYHSGTTEDAGQSVETGYAIAATTWYLPGWAVLDGNGTRTFAYLSFKDGVPSKACDTDLGPVEGRAYMTNDYSWFVVAAGNDLWYIDHTRGPVFARNQSFDFGITGLAAMS